ncbi:MAG: hypothetical protein J6T10_23000 [Methanobrevibacter sp.]|nr:hypothetical protein [Methanobrevibacter sp.]
MALNFRLNGEQIYPIVNTTITERVGTFSDGSLPLELSNIKGCFLPMAELSITDTENNSKWLYVVLADDVETVTKMGTIYYRHNLTVRSGIYETKKHILRNTSFTQPPRILKATTNQLLAWKGAFISSTPFFYPESQSGKDNYSHFDIQVSSRTKIAKATIKLSSFLWEYPQGNSNLDNPTRYKNKHDRIEIKILKYSGTVLMDSVSYTTYSKTELKLNVDHNVFRNFNDDSTLRIQVIHDATFIPNSSMNAGGIAVVKAELEVESYYYSMYDIVEIVREQSLKYYNGANSLQLACLEMTDATKIAELQSIIAPEISFNGMTYYDALYQLFSYIDAIPVVDKNGNLSFEYLNDNNGEVIDIKDKLADERISINDEYYTTKLVANYQNGRQENAISYPSNNKKCRVGTKSLGIPENKGQYVLRLPKPIDYIDKLVIATGTLDFNVTFLYVNQGTHLSQTFKNLNISELEMQDRTLESSVYSTLNDNREFYEETRLLCNCLCYTRGSEYIDLLDEPSLTILTHEIYKYAIMAQLSFEMGVPSNSTIAKYDGDKVVEIDDIESDVERDICDKQDIYFKIQYHALFDGRVEQVSTKDRYEGESFVAQDSTQVHLNRMGNNLQGLITKVGNEIENITFNVSSYGSRIKLGSIWYNDDNERFLANVVQTTFSTDTNKVIVKAQFTKNFNMLSQYTKIDQQKRFYEVSELITSKGYENITEYIYFTYEQPYNSYYESSAIVSDEFLETLVGDTLLVTTQEFKASYATIKCYPRYYDIVSATNGYVYLPMHSYGSGNSICFEMDFDNQINAGNRLTGGGDEEKYFAKSTLYTISSGFADKVDIAIWNDNYSGVEITYSENFPIISNIVEPKVINIEGFNYYKKPSEIFHLNYALAFLSGYNEEFFFGDKFINDNAVIPNCVLSRNVYFSYGNKKYSIIDNKDINGNILNCLISTDIQTIDDKKYLQVTIDLASSITCKSWALIDENNNILIASNKTLEEENQIIFYVIPRRNRI